jgi:hypothetical protein
MQLLFGVKPVKYEDGTSLADVMTWNHYGTETIPPRPVLRIAAENVSDRGEIKDLLAVFAQNILENPNPADHVKAEKEILRKIAQQVIKEAERIIEAGNELQENAPGTVRQKGFNKPLYETGLLIENLGYDYEE